MRHIVTSNIKLACASLGGHTRPPEELHDVGSLADEVAAVAKMCNIPATEVHFETEGTFRGTYRRSGSQVLQDIFADCGPSYLKEAHHKHWYHVGQHYHHAALANGDRAGPPHRQLIDELQHVLKRRSSRKVSLAGHTEGVEDFLHKFSADDSCDGGSSDGMMLTEMGSGSSNGTAMQLGSEINSDSQTSTPTEAAAALTKPPYFAYGI